MRKATKILPLFFLLMLSAAPLRSQEGHLHTHDGNIVMDTVPTVRKVVSSEHLIGVRYSYNITGVNSSLDVKAKGINSPLCFELLYTFYHPLWGYMNYFGLQVGAKYCEYGFTSEYAYKAFAQKVTAFELPVLSAFHIDLGKHFRILASLGPFLGYRWKTDKPEGWDCFDRKWDYGLRGGAGLAFKLAPVEFHLEASYQYSFSFLYDPEKFSSAWWIYTYPWQLAISFGIHVKLK